MTETVLVGALAVGSLWLMSLGPWGTLAGLLVLVAVSAQYLVNRRRGW